MFWDYTKCEALYWNPNAPELFQQTMFYHIVLVGRHSLKKRMLKNETLHNVCCWKSKKRANNHAIKKYFVQN